MAKSKKLNINKQLYAIMLVIIGALFCIFRDGMLNILLTVAGALVIILGIIDLLNNQLIPGIVKLVVGVAIIVLGWTILDIALLIIGIVLTVVGLLALFKAFTSNRSHKLGALVEPLLLTVLGIILIVAKWALGEVICIVIGVYIIIYGLLLLLGKK